MRVCSHWHTCTELKFDGATRCRCMGSRGTMVGDAMPCHVMPRGSAASLWVGHLTSGLVRRGTLLTRACS